MKKVYAVYFSVNNYNESTCDLYMICSSKEKASKVINEYKDEVRKTFCDTMDLDLDNEEDRKWYDENVEEDHYDCGFNIVNKHGDDYVSITFDEVELDKLIYNYMPR